MPRSREATRDVEAGARVLLVPRTIPTTCCRPPKHVAIVDDIRVLSSNGHRVVVESHKDARAQSVRIIVAGPFVVVHNL